MLGSAFASALGVALCVAAAQQAEPTDCASDTSGLTDLDDADVFRVKLKREFLKPHHLNFTITMKPHNCPAGSVLVGATVTVCEWGARAAVRARGPRLFAVTRAGPARRAASAHCVAYCARCVSRRALRATDPAGTVRAV